MSLFSPHGTHSAPWTRPWGLICCTLDGTVFRGHHFFDGLLEASNVRLKEELNLVTPLEVWRGEFSATRSAAREEARQSTEIGGVIYLRQGDVVTIRGGFKNVRD